MVDCARWQERAWPSLPRDLDRPFPWSHISVQRGEVARFGNVVLHRSQLGLPQLIIVPLAVLPWVQIWQEGGEAQLGG